MKRVLSIAYETLKGEKSGTGPKFAGRCGARGLPICLKVWDLSPIFHRAPASGRRGYLPFTIESEILPRSRSIRSTHTVTVSPTVTTSLGCLTKRLAIFEMCTRPS